MHEFFSKARLSAGIFSRAYDLLFLGITACRIFFTQVSLAGIFFFFGRGGGELSHFQWSVPNLTSIHPRQLLSTNSTIKRAAWIRLQNGPYFAYSSAREQSNKRSGTRLKTESDIDWGLILSKHRQHGGNPGQILVTRPHKLY